MHLPLNQSQQAPVVCYALQQGTTPDTLRIRLSAHDMIMDGCSDVAEAQHRLYRDDPHLVASIFTETQRNRDAHFGPASYDCAYDGMSCTPYVAAKRPRLSKSARNHKPAKTQKGLTVSEIAEDAALWQTDGFWAGADKAATPSAEAVRRLMIEHGWLTTAPYGRNQARTLATDKTINGGYGDNIDPSAIHSIRLSGAKRSFPFPVFWTARVPEVVASLGWPQIISNVSAFPRKQERLGWLMNRHAYLPTNTLSDLSGMALASVKRAKAKPTNN
ncbi:hypothetical protein DB34_13640 [Acetobacter pasteurianus]|nr:hypothetical protein DB34_13640 [Acetobacter pasteurianus]